jgi:hypothetical protein
MNPQAIEITAAKFRDEINAKFQEVEKAEIDRRFSINSYGRSTTSYDNVMFVIQNLDIGEPVPYPDQDMHWTAIDWSVHWVKYITSVDPTPKSIYTKWLLRQWLEGAFPLFEDVSTAGDLLEDYDGGKKTLPLEFRDINRMKRLVDVRQAVAMIDPAKLISNRQMERGIGRKMMASGDAILDYEDADIRIVIPKTAQAAKYYGRNTRWCTSARNGNMFNSYAKSGQLHIILFKKTNTRWQFQMAGGHFMDETDTAIPLDVIRKSAVFKLFDWKTAFERHPRLYPMLLRPNKSQRLAYIRWDGRKALGMKNLTADEIHTAVESHPQLFMGIDTRFHGEDLRKVALGRLPNLILKVANPTPEEVRNALAAEPHLIISMGDDLVDEKMWHHAVFRNTTAHIDDGRRRTFIGRTSLETVRRERTTLADRPMIYHMPIKYLTVEFLKKYHYVCEPHNKGELPEFNMELFNPRNRDELSQIMSRIMEFFHSTLDRGSHRYYNYDKYTRFENRLRDSYDKAIKRFDVFYTLDGYNDRYIRALNTAKMVARYGDWEIT